MKNKFIIGILISLAVLAPGLARAAAEPEVAWPTEWTAFGPGVSEYQQDNPAIDDLLPGTVLKTIPAELTIGKSRFRGQPVRLGTNLFDLAVLMPPTTGAAALKGQVINVDGGHILQRL